MKMHAHTCTHTYSSEQALSDKRGLGASWGIEGERRGRLESHFQSEREAPHQTCCTSAVVDTAQVNSDGGQLALVPQFEVSDY